MAEASSSSLRGSPSSNGNDRRSLERSREATMDGVLPPIISHANTSYGDWIAEMDSSAPLLADQIYGEQDRDTTTAIGRPTQRRGYSHRSKSSAIDGANNDDLVEEEEEGKDEAVDDEHVRWARNKKWYRRPDEKWLRPFAFLLALASGAIMGAKIEMYYSLVCEEMGISGLESLDMQFAVRPPVSTQCHKSAVANAAQANLQLRLTLAMGILSAITTGYWGSLSDRMGRTFVLRLAVAGLTVNDAFFLLVGLFPVSSLPFGKNFLVIGSALEGCLGGFATLAAGHQAYIADVTPNGTRAKIFSFFGGILFLGFAVGPSFGGILSKSTDSLMSPFYFAIASHALYLFFTIVILPESVSPERQQRAKEEYIKQTSASQETAQTQSMLTNIKTSLLIPLRPLILFIPHRRHDDKATQEANAANQSNTSHISVSKTKIDKLDWNLTFLALSYFLGSSCFGVLGAKINYAQYTFDWNVQQLGYYLSVGSISRVVCLTVVIPLFIKWWHKPLQGIALPHDGSNCEQEEQMQESRHLLDGDGRPSNVASSTYGSTTSSHEQPRSTAKKVEKLWTLRARHLRQIHDSAFDKRLAIISVGIDAVCYLLFAVSRNMGPVPFVAITAITSLGAASSAAMSSLALALLERDSDAGKLFAGWSVLSAIGATVIGPIVFIELYAKTVAFAPESIFVLAFVLFFTSALALCFVQVRKPTSLPSLPPRPHTPASIRAKTQQQRITNGTASHRSNSSTNPM